MVALDGWSSSDARDAKCSDSCCEEANDGGAHERTNESAICHERRVDRPEAKRRPAQRNAHYLGPMFGRGLNDRELASYRHIPSALTERARVHEIPALPGRYLGITLGRHIFLATDVSDDGDSSLLAHELVHVRQWHEQGAVRFIVRYVGSFLGSLPSTRSWNRSYRAIPAEVEARSEATRWSRSRQAESG